MDAGLIDVDSMDNSCFLDLGNNSALLSRQQDSERPISDRISKILRDGGPITNVAKYGQASNSQICSSSLINNAAPGTTGPLLESLDQVRRHQTGTRQLLDQQQSDSLISLSRQSKYQSTSDLPLSRLVHNDDQTKSQQQQRQLDVNITSSNIKANSSTDKYGDKYDNLGDRCKYLSELDIELDCSKYNSKTSDALDLNRYKSYNSSKADSMLRFVDNISPTSYSRPYSQLDRTSTSLFQNEDFDDILNRRAINNSFSLVNGKSYLFSTTATATATAPTTTTSSATATTTTTTTTAIPGSALLYGQSKSYLTSNQNNEDNSYLLSSSAKSRINPLTSFEDMSRYEPKSSTYDPDILSRLDNLSNQINSSKYYRHLNSGTIATTTTTNATLSSSSITNVPNLTTTIANNSSKYLQDTLSNSKQQQQQQQQQQQSLKRLIDDRRHIDSLVDSIDIPAKGRCKVYMAKYAYDPFEQSPNEQPDDELALNPGDYIMVFDDIDEDGYFIGELIDGRRGYVPSNYLERLTGDDLFDFQANVLYKQANSNQLAQVLAGADDPDCTKFPPEFYEALVKDTLNHSNFQQLHLDPEDFHRMNDYVDLDDVNEVDDECLSDYERAEAEQMRRAVPPPQRLILERQLYKSILISWLHPQAVKGSIVSYQIYVDGVLKSTVPSGDRTKALLEGVDSNVPHRISVRAIDTQGAHSNDAACTIVTGRHVPFAPACVKASHITSDSALISWLPCNSNFHHVVAVNSVEVQTVRPGVYKHLINGLSANTMYRVWVRAKPGVILSVDEKNPKKLESLTTYVDFKTLPKSLPDPPVNVQVEAGPQRRTLLVTWLPLTLNDFGVSNGCPVTGYAVFAGHKKLADIDSPTGDHALLDLSDLESLHKKSVTVRTKSGENLSQDSMPCHIPDEYLKSTTVNPLHHHNHNQQQQHHHHHQHQHHQLHHNTPASRLSSSNAHQVALHLSPHRQQGRFQNRSSYSNRYGNQFAGSSRNKHISRSVQNLELQSDLESHRSSIPAIEVTRETSGSELNINPNCESYSEEEFETSMRCGRSQKHRNPGSSLSNRAQQQRFRQSRGESHSLDGSYSGKLMNQHQGQLAKAYRPGISNSSLVQRDFNGRKIRYMVALFDYDPSVMSPNPNAATEELSFKEGSIIRVFGDKGLDGFYHGELDGQVGFVPCNVVSEIRDPNLLLNLQEKQKQKQLFNQSQQAPIAMNQGNNLNIQQQQQQPQPQQQQQPVLPPGCRRMIALYDYDPQENSPNADTESEIPFKQGDVIYIYGKMDSDGFFMGEVERTKQRGLVPSNFLHDEVLQGNQNNQITLQQQQTQQQQQQIQNLSNQIRAPGPMNSTGIINQPLNQMNVGQRPQNLPPRMMDQMNMQQPQQQQLRGQIPGQQIQQQPQLQMQQQQLGNLVNRPSSLTLGTMNTTNQNIGQARPLNAMQGVASNPSLQNQQQLMQQQNTRFVGPPVQGTMNPIDAHQMGVNIGNSMQVNQPRAPMDRNNLMQNQNTGQMTQLMTNQQQQQQQHQQQQQQQAGGGVLSNLLISGKQIIGAATTPRGPPSQTNFGQQGNTMLQSGQQQNLNQMNPIDTMSRSQQVQQQGQQVGNGANMIYPNNTIDVMNQQNQGNIQAQAGDQFGQNAMMQPMNHQMAANHQFGPMGNQVRNTMGQAVGGDDQGGNILHAVKNIFKL